jgi:hypothetical protein
LAFEVLNPGIDFFLAMKALDGIFFPESCFVYIENLLFSTTASSVTLGGSSK